MQEALRVEQPQQAADARTMLTVVREVSFVITNIIIILSRLVLLHAISQRSDESLTRMVFLGGHPKKY